jgi:hypothetical protein
MRVGPPWLRWITLAAALVLLNASLTFGNIWPTPAIRWQAELSVELALCVLALALAGGWLGRPSPAVLRGFAIVWMALVIGRYADVTAPALYGREVNLYWDAQHMSGVAAMLVRVASLRLVVAVALGGLLTLAAFYAILRWALGQVADAVAVPRARWTLALLAAMGVSVFGVQRIHELQQARALRVGEADWSTPRRPLFSAPVAETYARQVRLVLQAHEARLHSDRLASAAPEAVDDLLHSDLSLVNGADVLLLFIESYGATSFDRPEFARPLSAARARLEGAIHDSNRDVVSAYVESPTFGGNSWLAHINLLSGVEVHDPDSNALLMTQKRDTLVTAFARHGYRTVALMPGMRQAWPEGAFYGFDDVYGRERLEYHGPEFGWWDIPDQFTFARMGALESRPGSSAPLFIFLPTITTHMPFSPIPPYQPDWRRLLTSTPYDTVEVDRALSSTPEWLHLGPDYVASLTYASDSLAGYLRSRVDRDFVMIVLGDHQPPSAVTGEGASWDVPVHVIASRNGRERVLDRLMARGFRAGLTPSHPSLSRMHALLPILLEAFGTITPAAEARRGPDVRPSPQAGR